MVVVFRRRRRRDHHQGCRRKLKRKLKRRRKLRGKVFVTSQGRCFVGVWCFLGLSLRLKL
jgi:hypothetical protein